MRQSLLPCKAFFIAPLALIASCSSSPELPPAPIVSERPAAQQLPDALRRTGYDAPDWGIGVQQPAPAGAPQPGAQQAVTVPAPGDAYSPYQAPQGAPAVRTSSADGQGVAQAGPAALSASEETWISRQALGQMQPPIQTQSRAPRSDAQPTSIERAPVPQTSVPTAGQASAATFDAATRSVMAGAKPMPRPETSAPTATSGGRYALHLASYRVVGNAQKGWSTLQKTHPGLLSGLQARGNAVTIPGKGDFVRLLVGPFSTPSDARVLCNQLESLNAYCKVLPFQGRAL